MRACVRERAGKEEEVEALEGPGGPETDDEGKEERGIRGTGRGTGVGREGPGANRRSLSDVFGPHTAIPPIVPREISLSRAQTLLAEFPGAVRADIVSISICSDRSRSPPMDARLKEGRSVSFG